MTGSPPQLALEGNRAVLRQGATLLEGLTDETFASPQRSWASIGAQYRHVLEHYHCFLEGLAANRVNYDARPRNEQIERYRAAALLATWSTLDALDALEGSGDRTISVQMDSGAGPGAPDWRSSSLGRELQFLCSHTIHHFALIKLLLEGVGLRLAPEFGVAPSTLAAQRPKSPTS